MFSPLTKIFWVSLSVHGDLICTELLCSANCCLSIHGDLICTEILCIANCCLSIHGDLICQNCCAVLTVELNSLLNLLLIFEVLSHSEIWKKSE